ncbi:uncharacterized protein LOC106011946 [Aplysia californica]|uniref:Uncharacterized protein LOC106011946 n=1 Tax=Aplysia californica TaxID=6500 RepID=A0ABM1A157_APLCA|nr:uncharacterized protein LOC106011946 [Aplysia californica]
MFHDAVESSPDNTSNMAGKCVGCLGGLLVFVALIAGGVAKINCKPPYFMPDKVHIKMTCTHDHGSDSACQLYITQSKTMATTNVFAPMDYIIDNQCTATVVASQLPAGKSFFEMGVVSFTSLSPEEKSVLSDPINIEKPTTTTTTTTTATSTTTSVN